MTFSGLPEEEIRRRNREARAKYGLPPTVTDPAVLEWVAASMERARKDRARKARTPRPPIPGAS